MRWCMRESKVKEVKEIELSEKEYMCTCVCVREREKEFGFGKGLYEKMCLEFTYASKISPYPNIRDVLDLSL